MQRIDAIREGRRAKRCEIVLKIKGRRKACPFVLGSLYVIRDKVASRAWVRTMLTVQAMSTASGSRIFACWAKPSFPQTLEPTEMLLVAVFTVPRVTH